MNDRIHTLSRKGIGGLVRLSALSLLAAVSVASARPGKAVAAGRPDGADLLPRPMRGAEAVFALGERFPEVASRHGLGVARLRQMLTGEDSLWVDQGGHLHHRCEFATSAENAVATETTGGVTLYYMVPYPEANTFRLHSKPGASRVIYLDFDGHTTSGTYWNSAYAGGKDFYSSAFDLDGVPGTVVTVEHLRIQNIWRRVAEDFMPFDVDVTTEDPGLSVLRGNGVRVVISPEHGWLPSSAAGIAYVGSFSLGSDTPCFVFSKSLSDSEKNIAEAASHEVGHTVGLHHDGQNGVTEYYRGYGDWAPIMGVGYYEPVTQWSKGEYSGASNKEDDLRIMTGYIPYRVDDHGDTTASATVLSLSAVDTDGVISGSADVDVFSFSTAGGPVVLDIAPADWGANLDILAELYDSNGARLASSNPSGLSANVSLSVGAGTFYLVVDGVGTGNPDTGYSDYASMGAYHITGSLPSGGVALAAPKAVASASGSTSGYAPLAVGFSSAGSTDSDGTIVNTFWDFGDGATSTDADPAHTFTQPGTYRAALMVTDNDGLTGSASVTVTVLDVPNEAPMAVASASPVTGIAPLSVTFSAAGSADSDGSIASYYWQFGDGGTSTSANPSHVYTAAGRYTATLRVTDNDGATATDTVTIEAAQDPGLTAFVAEIELSTESVPGGTQAIASVWVFDADLNPVSGATVNGIWSGLAYSDATATTVGGCATLTSRKTKSDGVFTFRVTDVIVPGYTYDPSLNAATSASISTTVTPPTVTAPTARIAASTESGLAPLPVTFDGSQSVDDGRIISYEWSFGDGSAASGAVVSHSYAGAGTYRATLSVTDDSGSKGTASVTIVVLDATSTTVYVSNIDSRLVSVPGGYVAEVTLSVLTQTGAPFAGATVTGTWSGAKSSTVTGTTGRDGTVVFQSPKARGDFSYTFRVTSVRAPGAYFDAAASNVALSAVIAP